jgi:hypothetical protein
VTRKNKAAENQVVPEVEALILAHLSKVVEERDGVLRAIIGVGYADGDKHTFRSPIDHAALGAVWRTDPKPSWRVVDRLSFDAWLADRDEYTDTDVEIRAGHEAEAYAVLAEHAPHLLVEAVRIRQGAEAEVLAECKRRKTSIAPGVELVKPEGRLTVKPASGAGDAIASMVAAGLITWDGRPLELEAAEEAS